MEVLVKTFKECLPSYRPSIVHDVIKNIQTSIDNIYRLVSFRSVLGLKQMANTHLTIPYLGPHRILSKKNRIKILTPVLRENGLCIY